MLLEDFVKTENQAKGIDATELFSNLFRVDESGLRKKAIAPAEGFKPRIVDTPTKPGKPRKIISLRFTAAFERDSVPSEDGTLAIEVLDSDHRIVWESIGGLL